MNATSTHDTKRSEDVRARIHVLSEIPDLWGSHVLRWARLNADKRPADDGQPVPHRNDEYLLYQTLLGAWPLGEAEEQAHEPFVERIQQYMEKATREAKVHTSWINPNEAYDQGLREFVRRILDREESTAFREDLLTLQPIVARMGMLNSLTQALLKLTLPGVPDIYQGQEVWDLSLVDPDNRRPVDYTTRRRLLDQLRARLARGDRAALARELYESWEDGRIKLYLIHQALGLRRERPELFARGEYLPLTPRGARDGHLIACARRQGGDCVIAAAPRLPATLMREREFALPEAEVWEDTWLEGPGEVLRGRFRNLFTGERVELRGRLPLPALLGGFPVALLERER